MLLSYKSNFLTAAQPLTISGGRQRRVRDDLLGDATVSPMVSSFKENLLQNGNTFGGAGWSGSGYSITANGTIIDPQGGFTASRLSFTTGSLIQALSVATTYTPFTITGWAKKAPSSSASTLIVASNDTFRNGTGISVPITLTDKWTRFQVSGAVLNTRAECTNSLGANLYFGALTDAANLAVGGNQLQGSFADSTTWRAATQTSVTPNDGIDPLGGKTAIGVYPTASANIHVIQVPVSTTVGAGSFTLYAKANGYNSVSLSNGPGTPNGWVHYTLSGSGTMSTIGSNWASASITLVSNGWYRLTITQTATDVWNAAWLYVNVSTPPAGGDTSPISGAGDGTSGVLIWDPRVLAPMSVDSTAAGSVDLWNLQVNYGVVAAETTSTQVTATGSNPPFTALISHPTATTQLVSRGSFSGSNYTFGGKARTISQNPYGVVYVQGPTGGNDANIALFPTNSLDFAYPDWTITLRNAQQIDGSPATWHAPYVRYCQVDFNKCYQVNLDTNGVMVRRFDDNGAGGITPTTLYSSYDTSGVSNSVGETHTYRFAVNRSGTHSIYRDGVLLTTFTDTTYVNSANASLVVGATSCRTEILSVYGPINADHSSAAATTTTVNNYITGGNGWYFLYDGGGTGTAGILRTNSKEDLLSPTWGWSNSSSTYSGWYGLRVGPAGWAVTKTIRNPSNTESTTYVVASGTGTTVALGTWYTFSVSHNGTASVVSLNGSTLTTFTDDTTTYGSYNWLSGSVGFSATRCNGEVMYVSSPIVESFHAFPSTVPYDGSGGNWVVSVPSFRDTRATASVSISRSSVMAHVRPRKDIEGWPLKLSPTNRLDEIDVFTEAPLSERYLTSLTSKSGVALYSTRKVNPNYEGNAMLVRRGSDNVCKEIGFLPNGELDVYTLVTHTGATNYLFQSENFSDSGWVQTGSPILRASTEVAAPNAKRTAYYLERNGTAAMYIARSIGQASGAYSGSVFGKAANGRYLALRLQGTNPQFVGATFDLATGVITTSAVNSGATNGSYTITHVGDGWYRCTVSCTLSTATSNFYISVVDAGTALVDTTTASIGQSVYIWGAQVNEGLTPFDYCATSGSAGVTSNGFVHRWYDQSNNWGKHNLLKDSDTATTANGNWSVNELSTASSTVPIPRAVSSSQTALKFVESATASALHYIQQNVGQLNGIDPFQGASLFSYSFYAKPAERYVIRLRARDAGTTLIASADFDLVQGKYQLDTGVSAAMSLVDPVNNWWLCSVTFTQTTFTGGPDAFYVTMLDVFGNSGGTYTGDGASGLYLAGGMVNVGLIPYAYVSSGTSNSGSRDLRNNQFDQQPYIVKDGLVQRLDGGRPALFTDGTTLATVRYLETLNFSQATPLTRLSSFKTMVAGLSGTGPMFFNSRTSTEVSLAATTGGLDVWTDTATDSSRLTGTVNVGDRFIVTEVYNGSSSYGVANGVVTSESLLGQTTLNGLVFGYNGDPTTGGRFASGYYGEVLVLAGAMSTTEAALIQSEMRDYWRAYSATLRNSFPVHSDPTASIKTIEVPTGTVNGDLMFIFVMCNGTTTINTPSGWNRLGDAATGSASTDVRFTVFYRVASSEPASYNVTFSGTAELVLASAAIAGVNNVTPKIGQYAFNSGTAATMTYNSIIADNPMSLLLAVDAARTPTGVTYQNPNGFTFATGGGTTNLGLSWNYRLEKTSGKKGPLTSQWTSSVSTDTFATVLIEVQVPGFTV